LGVYNRLVGKDNEIYPIILTDVKNILETVKKPPYLFVSFENKLILLLNIVFGI